MYLFVAILENDRHVGFAIVKSNNYANVTCQLGGACIIISTIHPKNANYLLHTNSVTTCPKDNVTTCPNVVSLTKCVILEKYGVPYI